MVVFCFSSFEKASGSSNTMIIFLTVLIWSAIFYAIKIFNITRGSEILVRYIKGALSRYLATL